MNQFLSSRITHPCAQNASLHSGCSAHRAFTLIELLCSCVVLTLLFGFGASMFSHSSSKAKLWQGARMVASELERARIQADVLGSPVAIFAQVAESPSSAHNHEGQAWRRLVSAIPTSQQENPIETWQADSNWLTLPKGIYFFSQENGAMPQASLLDGGLEVELQAGKNQVVNARGFAFGRRGRVLEVGQQENLSEAELKEHLCLSLGSAQPNGSGQLALGRKQRRIDLFIEPNTGRTRLIQH